MNPQNLECSLVKPRVSKNGVTPLTGVSNGRPSDEGVQIQGPSRLERVANPVSEEDQQVLKKSRGEDTEVMDIGMEAHDGSRNGIMTADGIDGMVCGDSVVASTGGGVQNRPSFRDMLTGHSVDASNVHAIPELDVDMHDDDVKISSVRKPSKGKANVAPSNTNREVTEVNGGKFGVLTSLDMELEAVEQQSKQQSEADPKLYNEEEIISS
ncbi:hypothetical protein V6N11_043004 [Hibiscus sabdariffa]|uniref:Uncharacterized protein n=1 Tax=Hibiscus sabdariffa TaxID=183260 RepID=A0ABR2QY20_9ROSI